MSVDVVKVDCGLCRQCCKNDAIILHPELGDDASQYETVETTHPITGAPCRMLAHKPNGDCIYLGEQGCTIHGRHPAICRKYDCAAQYVDLLRRFSKAERQRLVRSGLLDKEKNAAGRRMARKRGLLCATGAA